MKARIWNDSGWIKETDPDILKAKFDEILKEAGFKILGVLEHRFKPQRYTALWLLAESHFAVHTFPEFGRAYYEISSCNREYFVKILESLEKEDAV